MQEVPVTTRIRTRSMPHVETERLLGRLAYLRDNWVEICRKCEQKNDLRGRVREVIFIERALAIRDVPFELFSNGTMLNGRTIEQMRDERTAA